MKTKFWLWSLLGAGIFYIINILNREDVKLEMNTMRKK